MTKSICVCGIGLFSYLTYFHFWKFYAGQYIGDSRDKGEACANEKRKRCNRMLP